MTFFSAYPLPKMSETLKRLMHAAIITATLSLLAESATRYAQTRPQNLEDHLPQIFRAERPRLPRWFNRVTQPPQLAEQWISVGAGLTRHLRTDEFFQKNYDDAN